MTRNPFAAAGCLAVLAFAVPPSAAQIPDAVTNRRDPTPRVRYELGEDSQVQPGVPAGQLKGPFQFHSKVIADTVRKYWVYVPSQYSAEEAACVLVFQDGARAIHPNGVLRVPQVLDNLIAQGKIPVTIGIFVTPGQRGEVFPDDIGTGNPNNRDREYDVLDDNYTRFVVDELLPLVGESYQLTNDPRGRAIGGASSGAICAFTVAWHRPEEFANVISLIGSFTNIHGGHVYPQLVREAGKKPIRVFLQDGVEDLRNAANPDRDWHLQNQAMVAALSEKDYDMAHVFGQGGHSDDHGGAMLPLILQWIWRDYPGVDPPKVDLVAAAEAIDPVRIDLFPGFDPNASVDVTGTWNWNRSFGGRSTDYQLTIAKENGQLSGQLDWQRNGETQVAELIGAELLGNKLLFDIEREFNGRSFNVSYQGVCREQSIDGWMLTEFNGTQRDVAWHAERNH